MNSILVFARAPEPGKVKTRLAAHIGVEAAARLYAAMLKDTLKLAQEAAALCEAKVIVAYTPDDAFEPGPYSLLKFWDGERIPQIGNDLGEKMQRAIQNCFSQGATKVVTIGSDKPDLLPSSIQSAFEQLETHDLVFGPAHDGGFYMMGTSKRLPPKLFKKVTWSHDSTLQSILLNAKKLKLSVAHLPEGGDIDDFSDLKHLHFLEWLHPDFTDAAHTRAAIKQENFFADLE